MTSSHFDLKYYDILYFYSGKIQRLIDKVSDELCPCRQKIIKTKWAHWIMWYMKNSFEIYYNRDVQGVINRATETSFNYHNELLNDSTISKPLIDAFEELHTIIVEQFKEDLFNTTFSSYENYLRKTGDFLYQLCANSIFEISEITIPCEHLSNNEFDKTCDKSGCEHCIYFKEHGQYCDKDAEYKNYPKSLTLIYNNVYNKGNFGIMKLEKILEKIKNPNEVTLYLNMDLYRNWNYDKLLEFLTIADRYFKKVEIEVTNKIKWNIDDLHIKIRTRKISFNNVNFVVSDEEKFL